MSGAVRAGATPPPFYFFFDFFDFFATLLSIPFQFDITIECHAIVYHIAIPPSRSRFHYFFITPDAITLFAADITAAGQRAAAMRATRLFRGATCTLLLILR